MPVHSRQSRGTADSRLLWLLAMLALASAFTYFTLRGPMRGIKGSGDFIELYAPARALLHGDNGYDLKTARDHWMQADLPQAMTRQAVDLGLLYPPSTVFMLLPTGAVDWPTARVAMAIANTVAALLVVLAALALARFRPAGPRSLLLAAAIFALAPIHTSISMGQPTLLAVAPIVWAILLITRRRDGWAGVLLGVAAAFKAQLAAPFLIYFLLRGRWRPAVIGLAVFAVPMLGGIALLERTGDNWFADWTANIEVMRNGGFADPTPDNPDRYKMINLYYPLQMIIGNRAAAELLSMALAAAAGLALLLRMSRTPLHRHALLEAAAVATLLLLPVYHLFYDAALLALPVAWAFIAWTRGCRRWAVAALLPCAPFLVPGSAALGRWVRTGRLPEALLDNVALEASVMAHQVWALVLLSAILIAAAWWASGRRSGQPDHSTDTMTEATDAAPRPH